MRPTKPENAVLPDVRRLVTHAGPFHADDVFAAAIAQDLWPQAMLVRTREPDALLEAVEDAGTLVFDVGGVFDAEQLAFDHHQVSFTRERAGVPYASFGLLWEHFGRAWLRLRAPNLSNAQRRQVWLELEASLVSSVDAVDTGVAAWVGTSPRPVDVSRCVGDFNPWGTVDPAAYNAGFDDAVNFARAVLVRSADVFAFAATAAPLVAAADDGSDTLRLDAPLPWESGAREHHIYVLMPDVSRPGHWLLNTVSRPDNHFAPKQPLPEAWAGKRDDALASASGVADATFCHKARFIAGAASREGVEALLLAARAASKHSA